MTAAFWISIGAIVIAAGSLFLSLRADRRAGRGETREERRERREEEAAAARRRGRPVVSPGAVHGGPTAAQVTHEYTVRNTGPATITGLWLWIVDDEHKTVSDVAGGETLVLAQGDAPALASVAVPQPLPDEQMLMVRWRDIDGEHTEPTGIRPSRHA